MVDLRLSELSQVEEPFLRQLEGLGWRVLRGDKYDPASTERESFHEVIIESELRAALMQINPWLEDDQVDELVRRIQAPQSTQLLKANEEILGLLLEGQSVAENRQTREGHPNARYMDFNYTANNRFLAVSQFKVKIPGTEKHILPDVVLFVNGLPLVVVECKSPVVADPLGEAIEQLKRYANQRGMAEGNEKLFWFNQFRVATFRQQCRYASLTGGFDDYIEWKDPYPFKLSEIDTEGGEVVNSQQMLIQGMLHRETLLDIIHSYTVFGADSEGNTIKIIPRYQQYRTSRKIIDRLKTRNDPKERGGIVWHTQGSGKSLTMMFVARAVYHDSSLSKFKVVFITDRRDLQRQLGGTAGSVGYSLRPAASVSDLRRLLRTKTPDLILGMIHKFQDDQWSQTFPELNDSSDILVMIDEAHRSQYKLLGANLQVALPNAARIAFSGTPIEKTEREFGDYIDKYTMRQSLEDGVTVQIVYEGRAHKGEITDREAMNKRFEDVFAQFGKEERQLILGRYTLKAYLEDTETIRDKAADMFEHYVSHVFPNRFKAQVVAYTRLAAIRYKEALELARERRINEMIAHKAKREEIEQLQKMRVEVIISGSNNDEAVYKPHTDDDKHNKAIESFKLPFDKVNDRGVKGDVGILVVCDMLITGFDAPIEQVMYLDNIVRDHNLLQAIARVNRVSDKKEHGFVVDYVGIAHHLRRALAAYDEKDVDEILDVFHNHTADLDMLKYQHSLLTEFFSKYGVGDTNDIDACVDVLADEEIRDDFIALTRAFNRAMDRVLPNPAALKFAADLKLMAFIRESARNRFRDNKLSIKDASRKIRGIVDEYLVSKGVDPKIPPLEIFSPEFAARIKTRKSARANAEEITHAIRQHITENYETDPEFYDRLGEKLERVLAEYRDNWERLLKELEDVLESLKQGRENENNYGFDIKNELPFLALLKRELYSKTKMEELPEAERESLISTTADIIEMLRRETQQQVDFWENYSAQKRVRAYILNQLLSAFRGNKEFVKNRNQVVEKILELANYTHWN
jgi:type I restriction enzyme, R subunit